MQQPRVLSVQSHVVHGYVGNKSATFPLQVLGLEVDAVNTVQFSNHTGYPHFEGRALHKRGLSELVEGLRLNGLADYSHLLTGYALDVDSLAEIAQVVLVLRAANPHFKYVCDPVMGDDGRMYVPEEMLPVYRDAIVPLADLLTPNQFELESLTGTKIANVADARVAIDKLHAMGAKVVVLSSSELGDVDRMIALASVAHGDCYEIAIPKLPTRFTGTGDLFAALMLAWTHKSDGDVKTSLEKAIATMRVILNDTFNYAKAEACGSRKITIDKLELRLIQNKEAIENPVVDIFATKVDK